PSLADDGQQFQARAADFLRGGLPVNQLGEQFLDAGFVWHGSLLRGRDRARLLAPGTAQDGSGGVAPRPRSPSRSVRSWRPRSSRRWTVLGTTPSSSAASA